MRRVLLLALLIACGKDQAAPPPIDARVTPTTVDAAPAVPPPPAKPALQLQLRSTPVGAEASVDGRAVGKTPVVVDVPDDGGEHDFVFVLPGYASEHYKTRPLKSGVIHARMRAGSGDAGP